MTSHDYLWSQLYVSGNIQVFWWCLELCNSTAVSDLVFSSSPSCLSGWAVLICVILYHRATDCSHNFIYSSVTHRVYLYASPYSLIFLTYFHLLYHLCWWVGSLTWCYKSSVYLVLSFCYLIYLFVFSFNLGKKNFIFSKNCFVILTDPFSEQHVYSLRI